MYVHSYVMNSHTFLCFRAIFRVSIYIPLKNYEIRFKNVFIFIKSNQIFRKNLNISYEFFQKCFELNTRVDNNYTYIL